MPRELTPGNAADRPIRTFGGLLKATGCLDHEHLEDFLDEQVEEPLDLELEKSTPAGDIEMSIGRRRGIWIGHRCYELSYPFTLQELLEAVGRLEEAGRVDLACQKLEDQIMRVDAIWVEVTPVDYVDGWSPQPDPLKDYPYRRMLPDGRTFEDWVDIRFSRHYPEYEVAIADGIDLPYTTSLLELRTTRGTSTAALVMEMQTESRLLSAIDRASTSLEELGHGRGLGRLVP